MYVANYPFQKLLQYLKFGFSLSITNPDSITNNSVTNHFSALQYPKQVTEYLTNEKAKEPSWVQLMLLTPNIITILLSLLGLRTWIREE